MPTPGGSTPRKSKFQSFLRAGVKTSGAALPGKSRMRRTQHLFRRLALDIFALRTMESSFCTASGCFLALAFIYSVFGFRLRQRLCFLFRERMPQAVLKGSCFRVERVPRSCSSVALRTNPSHRRITPMSGPPWLAFRDRPLESPPAPCASLHS